MNESDRDSINEEIHASLNSEFYDDQAPNNQSRRLNSGASYLEQSMQNAQKVLETTIQTNSLDSHGDPVNEEETKEELCEYHKQPVVAFCTLHSEMVCEECTDFERHSGHTDQFLFLKAAA